MKIQGTVQTSMIVASITSMELHVYPGESRHWTQVSAATAIAERLLDKTEATMRERGFCPGHRHCHAITTIPGMNLMLELTFRLSYATFYKPIHGFLEGITSDLAGAISLTLFQSP